MFRCTKRSPSSTINSRRRYAYASQVTLYVMNISLFELLEGYCENLQSNCNQQRETNVTTRSYAKSEFKKKVHRN